MHKYNSISNFKKHISLPALVWVRMDFSRDPNSVCEETLRQQCLTYHYLQFI